MRHCATIWTSISNKECPDCREIGDSRRMTITDVDVSGDEVRVICQCLVCSCTDTFTDSGGYDGQANNYEWTLKHGINKEKIKALRHEKQVKAFWKEYRRLRELYKSDKEAFFRRKANRDVRRRMNWWWAEEMVSNALPTHMLDSFAYYKNLPENNCKTVKFRRAAPFQEQRGLTQSAQSPRSGTERS